ncbi:hypothetical protein Asp14428_20100 [Actinoplanes sp. NBRC 14428]|nr:hypothetical protein Asp14428_20100 [Actinoplanes sp. NBRC 14428]
MPVAGVLLVVAGLLVLGRAGDGLRTGSVRAEGVPMEIVRPDTDGPDRPAVVVAHGFAGSGRLMRPFADTLARRGYVVALPDLAGHAASPRPLTGEGDVDRDLDAAIRSVRALPGVDPARVVLVGHSMGAAAVVRAGTRDRRIAATVAISLGDDAAAAARPGPRRLLLLLGALEPAGIGATSEAADGDRLVRVPLVEHIGVLYADRTHHETARWLDQAVGNRPERPVIAAKRRLAAGALLLTGMLLLVLAATGRRARRLRPALPARGTWPAIALGTAAAAPAGLAGGTVLWATMQATVCGYVIGYFAGAGTALSVAAMVIRRGTGPRLRLPSWRSAASAAALTLAGPAAVVIPIHLGLTSAVPYGAHRTPLILLAAATALLLAAAHALAGPPWSAVVLALVCTPLPLAAVIGAAPGFLALVTPLIAGLLALHLLVAGCAWLGGIPWWRTVAAGALTVAWPVATALPIA